MLSETDRFFLKSLIKVTKRLAAKYEVYSKLKIALNTRQKQIVAYIKKQKTAQLREITDNVDHQSKNTIKKDLALLVKEGILLMTGRGRGVHYHIKEH